MKVPALEMDKKAILNKPLLQVCSSVTVRNDLFDMGIYCCSHWILEFIMKTPSVNSIATDVVPYLVKRQFNTAEYLHSCVPGLSNRKYPLEVVEPWLVSGGQSSSSVLADQVLIHLMQQNVIDSQDSQDRSSANSLSHTSASADSDDCLSSLNPDLLRCYALVYDDNTTVDSSLRGKSSSSGQSQGSIPLNFMCQKIRNMQTYLNMNKYVILEIISIFLN